MRKRLTDLASKLEGRVRARVRAALDGAAEAAVNATAKAAASSELQVNSKTANDLAETADDPPVVARLIVEIRSDGTRTVARGALKDELSGEQVAIVARGDSPLELAAQLARALVTTPFSAGQIAKSMLHTRLNSRRSDKGSGS
jgi:uncharacterized protein YicC (UPF0701 family)